MKALDAPMLWYVEQAVPDPRCTLASTVCPSVNALVPQVYLPEGYAQALSVPTGGTISGENIKLTIDGQLRNTGQVIAQDTLTVKAESIDLSPNVVSIGTNAYKAQGGWNVVTGTVVQPGGFLSAMHMDIEADSIRAINDAFRVTRADGSVDPEASAALVAQLKESLGLNYTEGTVADDIHTQFIKEKKGFGIIGQIVAMVAAVAISIVTAGAGAALMGVALAEMSVMQAALAVAIDGLIAGTLSSMVSQVITTGSLNIGAALKSGAISGLTAGLTQGALGAMNLSNSGIGSIGDNLAKGNWTQAAGQLGNYAQASIVRSAISAGINTAVYGGSFGQAFAGGLVRDAAALAANAAGVKLPGIGSDGANTETIIANAAAHALIGCAAQGLTGGDCAGGAIGGVASAISAPLIRDALYADSPVLSYSDDPVRQALTVGLATLIGGATGQLLGANSTSAALAAQNESLNNATSSAKKPAIPDDVRKLMDAERRAFGQTGSVPNSGGGSGDPAMVGPSPLVLGGAKGGAPREIGISRSLYPESAQHIEDGIAAGQPSTLTIDRAGAAARRADALRGIDTKPGLDRDEFPPAMFKEGGAGASVRPISPSDNRGAGACIGAQCRGLPDGTKVEIKVTK